MRFFNITFKEIKMKANKFIRKVRQGDELQSKRKQEMLHILTIAVK